MKAPDIQKSNVGGPSISRKKEKNLTLIKKYFCLFDRKNCLFIIFSGKSLSFYIKMIIINIIIFLSGVWHYESSNRRYGL